MRAERSVREKARWLRCDGDGGGGLGASKEIGERESEVARGAGGGWRWLWVAGGVARDGEKESRE